MGTIQIRELTVADRDWLSDLIKRLVAKLGNSEILKLMVSDSEAKEVNETEVESAKEKKYALLVVRLIELMIDVIGDDVRKWFADLVGKTTEEFKALPICTELDILEQLMAVEEANRFFSRVLALSSRIKGFAAGLKGTSQA